MKLGYSLSDGIGVITLKDPPENYLHRPDFEDQERLRSFLESDGMRCLVIEGEGRNFCSGADPEGIRAQAKDKEEFYKRLQKGKHLLKLIRTARVPSAAVIKGACLGAGLEIALSCTFRFVSDNSVLGFPETGLDLIPGFGGTIYSTELLKKSNAIDLILSSGIIQGEEAVHKGLADTSAKSSEIRMKAFDYLNKLTHDKPEYVIHSAMESINNPDRMSRNEALKQESRLFAELAQRSGKTNKKG